jgi:MGT family glycosyltransferase
LSRILAYTSPAHGHLFPAVAVLAELRRRGHEVAIRTLAGEVGAMGALGFEAAPIAAEIEALEMEDWRARSPLGAMRRGVRTVCARAGHEAPDLLCAIDEERPDALLVDVLSWGALSAAESWGGPWACFAPLLLPLAGGEGPPVGPGLRPAGPLGRTRDRLLRSLMRAGLDQLAAESLASLRGGLGLAPLGHVDDLFLAPPLLLYMTAEPIEYPRREWPPNIVMVGPCEWEPPGGLSAELEAIEEPLVLVTTSSEFQDDGRLVATTLEALAGERLHVVATMPSARAARLDPPDNATVLDFAPHTPILERSVCAITHGGMGATQKALNAAVPVCVVPFGRDQPEVARRVEVAAAGSRLPASRLAAGALRTKVHEAIDRAPGAARVSRAFAAAGGATAAADAFEQRLGLGGSAANPLA